MRPDPEALHHYLTQRAVVAADLFVIGLLLGYSFAGRIRRYLSRRQARHIPDAQ
ncbi:hypothetical protein OHB12_14330 [Nocardia sp. NBC_01730]|uniref:hypothetical protein n=1 Tax=Nocardia sp. NBC_01730 TaxID=2975998 RepID=UPI002E1572AD|nr:hypothetical protein OHB12_14330 [Nocardia sp. NBC_01730]